jgi:hypothetical protein
VIAIERPATRHILATTMAGMAMAPTAGAVAIAATLAAVVTAGAAAMGGAVAMATGPMATIVPMATMAGPAADPRWFLGIVVGPDA